jgi:hypothetical protein
MRHTQHLTRRPTSPPLVLRLLDILDMQGQVFQLMVTLRNICLNLTRPEGLMGILRLLRIRLLVKGRRGTMVKATMEIGRMTIGGRSEIQERPGHLTKGGNMARAKRTREARALEITPMLDEVVSIISVLNILSNLFFN